MKVNGNEISQIGKEADLIRRATGVPAEILAVGFGRSFSVVHHQVHGHLSFQAADVAVTEVVAKLVDLQ